MQQIQSNDNNLSCTEERTRPIPINIESSFFYDELFFSITDTKSTIKFANDVFLRVAKYSNDEIIGQYHNIIRHPDMPKAAFKILWDYLKADKSVAVYVKNLAKDGSYYWVTALVFPCEGGYLSIRLKPGSAVFETVKELYKKTLAYEKELEQTHSRSDVVRLSTIYLLSEINNLGFQGYDQFMRYALLQENLNRIKHLKKIDNTIKKTDEGHSEVDTLEIVGLILSEFVTYTNQLHQIHTRLNEHSNLLLDLSKNIQAISQNARLQSSKLDRDDQSLYVVSETMGEQTKRGEQSLSELIGNLQNLHTIFSDLSFDIISSELQVEMTRKYELELRNSSLLNTQLPEQKLAATLLNKAYVPRLKRIYSAIKEIPSKQVELLSKLSNIEQFLTILRYIYVTGKVEISRLQSNELTFKETFEELRKEIDSAENHLHNLRNVMAENTSLFNEYECLNERLSTNCANIQ